MTQKNEQSKELESPAVATRIERFETAFKNGQLANHAAVKSMARGDAAGQRGWGPMMQT